MVCVELVCALVFVYVFIYRVVCNNIKVIRICIVPLYFHGGRFILPLLGLGGACSAVLVSCFI